MTARELIAKLEALPEEYKDLPVTVEAGCVSLDEGPTILQKTPRQTPLDGAVIDLS